MNQKGSYDEGIPTNFLFAEISLKFSTVKSQKSRGQFITDFQL